MNKQLNEIALLSKFSCRQWTARKFDRKATKAVNDAFNASKAGRFNKQLVDREDIRKIDAISQRARAVHYRLTLPWLDEGWRILPSTTYFDYTQEMRQFDSEFQQSVTKMVELYPDRVEQAREFLGELFNVSEYPTPDELRSKYFFGVSFRPIPTGEDFRCNIRGDELRKITAQIETQTHDATLDAVRDLYGRISDVLKTLQSKLATRDAIFRNSLIENVCSLMDILPKLNITNDRNLSAIHKRITNNICSLSPDAIRSNEAVRKDTAKEAGAILRKMSGFLNQSK